MAHNPSVGYAIFALNAERKRNSFKFQSSRMKAGNNTCTFNWSDMKEDKTIYLDGTPGRKSHNFDPNEISGRSTTVQTSRNIQQFKDMGVDEILMSSTCPAVRTMRESMSSRPSMPRTADISLRSTMSSIPRPSKDFWDNSNIQQASCFAGKNLSISSDDFQPSEQMKDKMEADMVAQDQEYAPIPTNQRSHNDTTFNWDRATPEMRQPQISFGEFYQQKAGSLTARDMCPAQSPPKRANRLALIDITQSSSSGATNESNATKLKNKYLTNTQKLESFISKWLQFQSRAVD